ncbi:beta strand repeat-containing protein, partial [Flavobacterium aestuarii]|uniref:beta strand repeat-containing protein n=1 Tax=Flavobacterium aestuarii TaxID=3149227 RepID=UPI003EC04BD6
MKTKLLHTLSLFLIVFSLQAQNTWTVRNSTGNILNDIIYANSLYVAVGGSGTILTSPDAVNWTTRTSGHTATLFSIAYGNGKFVAVGNNKITTSSDGITWSSVASTTVFANTIYLSGVRFINGNFVMVGDFGAIATSTDGTSWTKRQENALNGSDVPWLLEVTFGTGTYCAVSDEGAILTSTNLTTWTPRTSGTTSKLTSVIYDMGKFVAAGAISVPVLTSPDGSTWTANTNPVSSVIVGGLTSTGNKFVSVGGNSTVMASPDGQAWTQVTTTGLGTNLLNSVIFTGTQFVAVGSGGLIATSPLALATPTVTTTAATGVGAVKAVLGGDVTNDGGASVSERGIVWATTANPTTANTKVSNGSGTGTFSATISSLTAGTTIHFRAYAINSQGTSYGSDLTFTTNAALSATTNQTNVSCNGGNTGVATVTPSGGKTSYSYSWSPSGGTSATASALFPGSYTCTITDSESTQITKNFTITQPPALAKSTTVTNVACNGGTTGAIDLTPSGGTPGYTYNWVGGNTTQDRTALAAGTYSVTITDANGCTTTASGITVTQPTAVSGTTTVTNVACNSGTTGVIDLTPTGGTPGYTYNWGGGITTQDRTGLAAGGYSVTITDANACTATVSGITVTQPTAISGTTTVTNVACFGGNTGAINLTPTGGTGPYTFNWGGGITSEDRTGLTAGSYSVTITDANGCTGTVSPTITQPAASVSGTTVVTNVACFGGNTGAIDLTPTGGTGPYTFNWGGGITTEDRTGLTAGSYSVTITDANGCTGTVSPTVTQPAASVSGTTVVTNVACFGGNTGAINLTPTGGVGPYTYNWVGGATTEDRTGLTPGSYSVTITDANGCTGTVSPTVTQPAAVVSGTTVVTNVACFGGNTGAINLTPTGGVGPYTY